MSHATSLKRALARCRNGFAAAALFSLCINLLMLTAPLYMLQVFDRVLSSQSRETLLYLTVIAGFAYLVLALLEFARGRILLRMAGWLDQRLSPDILRQAISDGLASARMRSTQGLSDMAQIRQFLSGPGFPPVMDAPWTPIFIAVTFFLHPWLGWLTLAGAVVLLALTGINEWAIKYPVRHGNLSAVKGRHWAETAVRNADVIEAMGLMPAMIGGWRTRNDETLAAQARAGDRNAAIKAATRLIRMLLQIGMLGLGAYLVLENELTAGGMIAGTILAGRALAPVDQAVGSWQAAVSARGAYQRLKALFQNLAPRGEGMALPAPKGALNVENVTYFHDGAKAPALHKLRFALAPGECLGVIGPTAAGKTTLARLLVGNLKPQAGHVRLDGVDMGAWTPDERGRHVGYLPQAVELFDGTVHDNIARLDQADAATTVKAARFVGVHEVILKLPNGYDTEIGEDGGALSAGQRQRIGLARALYSEPRLVVLDEPNSNLDPDGEHALMATLAKLKRAKVTSILVTHRPQVLQLADKILMLRDSRQQLFGPRDEVLKKLVDAKTEKPAAPRGASK
jgi:PrtD family type I secretion system ABC transporter